MSQVYPKISQHSSQPMNFKVSTANVPACIQSKMLLRNDQMKKKIKSKLIGIRYYLFRSSKIRLELSSDSTTTVSWSFNDSDQSTDSFEKFFLKKNNEIFFSFNTGFLTFRDPLFQLMEELFIAYENGDGFGFH